MEINIVEGIGFANALRRTLLSDVRSEAPYNVMVHVNQSCETDEFIAHRIGLIPLRRTGNGSTMQVKCSGPKMVTAADFESVAFEAVYPDIDIIPLGVGCELRLTIYVDEQRASKHARYSPCCKVGMKVHDGACTLKFESINATPERDLLRMALDEMERKVDDALQQLAHQPPVPPQSYC